MSQEHPHDHDSHAGGHETSDASYGGMIWAIPFSLVLLAVFTAVVVFLTAGAATTEMHAKELEGTASGRERLLAFRAHEDSLLHSYGRDTAGHLRIPIDSAMKAVAARGVRATP